MGEIGVPGLARGLIGRAREAELLAGLLAQAGTGQGSAVLIEGEPGIGKTALVRAALAGRPAGCAGALGHLR